MAIKVFDGYDHYKAGTDLYQRSGWLQYETLDPSHLSFITGRNGFGQALAMTGLSDGGNIRNYLVFGDRNAEAYVGLAFLNTSGKGGYIVLTDSIGAAYQVVIHLDESNYSISAYRGGSFSVFGFSGTLLGRSANNVWTGNVWQFFEVHPVIGSSGSVEVRINNEAKLTIPSANTQQTANAWFDKLGFTESPIGNSGTFLTVDDFYYNDNTAGPGLVPADTYLGDSCTDTLFAVGNDSVAFTPLSGTNYQMIDEVQMDSDTTYNSSSTVNQEDRFNYTATRNALTTAYALQVTGAYRKDDGGTRTIEQAVKSGSTEAYSSGHNIPDVNYAYYTDLWVLNPDTGFNWTKAEIDAMKAGYKLTA